MSNLVKEMESFMLLMSAILGNELADAEVKQASENSTLPPTIPMQKPTIYEHICHPSMASQNKSIMLGQKMD